MGSRADGCRRDFHRRRRFQRAHLPVTSVGGLIHTALKGFLPATSSGPLGSLVASFALKAMLTWAHRNGVLIRLIPASPIRTPTSSFNGREVSDPHAGYACCRSAEVVIPSSHPAAPLAPQPSGAARRHASSADSNTFADLSGDVSQFTSSDWQSFLKMHRMQPSMSRRGNCHDNAVAESFFSALKKERIKRRIYPTRAAPACSTRSASVGDRPQSSAPTTARNSRAGP